ncbi:uncharacterized protein LOC135957525 [Calliphora vicina]|uniref:uncharacterized protein LOC135957525 n=1 Tax=Calliphora vicina TaxID=7373 RepID=UPI00325AAEA3
MSFKSTKPKHILELTAQEKQKFLDSFDTVLSDCDGVVWLLLEGIPNAGQAINLIKDEGKHYKFISNNSMRTDEQYLQKFKETGVQNVNKEDLVYPVKAIIKHINQNFSQQPCLVLGSKSFKATLKENGVNVKTVITPPDIELEDLPALIKPTDQVAAVIFDIHVNMTFIELALAQQYLMNKNCQLIVGAYDDSIPMSKNFSTLGPAGVINILAKTCHKEIQLFGKPGDLLGQYLLQHFQISQPKRVVFVGDNLDMDIKFGLKLGFQTLFVLSGAHSMEDMLGKPLESQPDYYADSMGDFLEFFNDLK